MTVSTAGQAQLYHPQFALGARKGAEGTEGLLNGVEALSEPGLTRTNPQGSQIIHAGGQGDQSNKGKWAAGQDAVCKCLNCKPTSG